MEHLVKMWNGSLLYVVNVDGSFCTLTNIRTSGVCRVWSKGVLPC